MSQTNPYTDFNQRAKQNGSPEMPTGDTELLIKALYVALQEESPVEYLLPIAWYLVEKAER